MGRSSRRIRPSDPSRRRATARNCPRRGRRVDQPSDHGRDRCPGGLSEGCHLGDDRLAPKFRGARCSEVALRRAGIAVPFVTPQRVSEVPAWMTVGFSVWEIATEVSAGVVETYPHGIFWRLAGRQLFHKQRAEGRDARIATLRQHLELPADVERWGHDAIDALACAWLAWCVNRGGAVEISCTADLDWPLHDGSSLWLPIANADPARSN